MNSTSWNTDLIISADQLRDLVGTPHEAVVKKNVSQMEEHVRHYLTLSPLFFLSTSDASGRCDSSPRGDDAGFVKPLDDFRLIYPERPGNRRIDSLLNMLENPQVGMLFVIPGMQEVLRINGRASLTTNAELIEQMNWSGKAPALAVIVEVQECFVHCPRALKQARVWDKEQWPEAEAMPSVSEMFKAHLRINGYEV
ncbi:phosphohydrolase [Paenibacillus sp. FSL H8-0548]|uniref:MSMEG_1061 family FMN-dependent PPOX-type flavoprotein n=1 Tax=Paenibacillus sp. FSL H8-0548 TaxID=1920422 RepID=UPI00096D85FA|nr:MSMEG_1061 family FMN-dependent PPOX-type flavoprotein [Paenibacillus sp. FSL H8-0548]OMF35916.1 phosphohydrolase [Paenibacillus sp. FSL H8-0548]